jgi:hypothetical protein
MDAHVIVTRHPGCPRYGVGGIENQDIGPGPVDARKRVWTQKSLANACNGNGCCE